MDWKALKDKAIALGETATEKAFTALEGASGHTYEGLKKTPVVLKNGEELDLARTGSLLVILVLGKEDALSKALLARLPLVFKDAWIYSANLKIVLSQETPDLSAALGVSEAPAIFVYRKGELEKTLVGEESLAFAKNFDLSRTKQSIIPQEVPEGKTDVLAEVDTPPKNPSESQ